MMNSGTNAEFADSLFFRNEFKAYKDVKPVKATKPQSQYKPPADDKDKSSLETSYSATYKGEQTKVQPTDNKLLERRRIRSLYNEPGGKETTKVSPHQHACDNEQWLFYVKMCI